MASWVRAARIQRTRNLEGSLVAVAADGLPFLLEPGDTAHLVPPTLEGPRTVTVREISELGEGRFEVSFAEVSDPDAAHRIVGSYCLVEADPERLPAQALDLAGFATIDEQAGPLGTVDRVERLAHQDRLAIDSPEHGEVLVPFVDEFVLGVDAEARTVSLRIPQGLLTLNAKGEREEPADPEEEADPC